jgi:hypothetical protein
MTAPTVQRVPVGPEMAREWLAHSARQPRRHTIHEDRVHRYAQLMRDGAWMELWTPIILDQDGHLVDGLHRLSAVIESGCTITFSIATGFPSTTAAYVRSRNIA